MNATAHAPDTAPAMADLDVFACPLDGTQLIEASAGTGKTWAICGLYLRLLLERRLTVQQLLVVTFTKAATAELRARVRARLAETLAALRADPGSAGGGDPFVPQLLAALRARGLDDAELAGRLDEALSAFDEAAIFTIHGFCQRALADTPFTAGLPLQLELLTDDRALLAEAVHDFWRQRVSAGSDPALAAGLLTPADTPERWQRLLARQRARPLSRLRWPAALDSAPGPAEDPAHLAAALQAAWAGARAAWAGDGAASARALLDAGGGAGAGALNANTYKPDAVALAFDGWAALLARAAPPATEAELPAKAELLGSAVLAARTRKGQTTPTHPLFDALQALLDALAGHGRALRLARLRLLRDLLDQGLARLRAAKRARRVVAFDDLLYQLHERLQAADGGDALARALRARFPAALIDEFQDTDPLQFAVFDRLYGRGRPGAEGAADGDDEATAPPMFLVGDPKQAIYSFRHADLHTYLRARDQAAARHTLGANQRAVAGLIAALNRLFGHNPAAFVQPGLHYPPVACGAKPRPPFVDRSAPRAALQVWTLPADAGDGQPLPKPLARRAAARACADEIARLLAAARRGEVLLDGRALRAGDIAVLVRSHAQGTVVRQALAARGVASVELSQASVFHSPDAEELERVLAAILEPARDGLQRAALATRALGWTADRLLALADDEAAQLAWVQRQAGYAALWRARGVGVMLRQWLHAEQVDRRLLAQPDGARRLTNLLHLAECLHAASAEHAAPEALLRWLQAARGDEAGGGDAEAAQLRLESDQNLVQVVTIHKSKGLEYPLVFCPFVWDGRPADDREGLDGVPGHDADGQPVLDFRKGLDEAFDEAAAKAEARREAAAESQRLLYVALTRAVQRCYLVAGPYRQQVGAHWSTSEAGRSGLNWLVLGAGQDAEDWLQARQPPGPAAVHAAWQALAATPGLPDGALAVSPLPDTTGPGTALAPDDAGAPPPQALPAPAALPVAWWTASYSSLLRNGGGDGGGDGGSDGVDPADHAAADGAAGPDAAAGAALADPAALAGSAPGAELPERAGLERSAADHDHDIAAVAAGGWPTEPDENALATDDAGPAGAEADDDERAVRAALAAWQAAGPGGWPGDGAAGAGSAPADGPEPPAWATEPGPPDDAEAAGTAFAEPAGPGATPPAPRAADDPLDFPRGAAAGDCVHAVFEQADFGDAAGWPAVIDRALAQHPPATGPAAPERARCAAMLQRLLADVLATPLPAGTATPLRLATLARTRRCHELEFHLPVRHLRARALDAALARWAPGCAPLAFPTLQGFLKGFIDLVFEHEGRYFIADWKSNHLGWQAADYRGAALDAAMLAHQYPLQALLYSVALHRWLRQRLPGYQPQQHFGGVLYLFVRGLRPAWCAADGTPAGLHFQRPDAAVLDALSALLEAPAP